MRGALVQAFHTTDGEDCLQRWSWKYAVHLCHLWTFSSTFVSEVFFNIVIFVKLCKELCPPTESYKRTGVPSTARDSLRFALSSMNLSRWLLLPSKSLQVEKNIVRLVPLMCVFSLGLHSQFLVFLLTKLTQQVLTDILRLSRPTCSSASSTLSTQTRALWQVPVI